MGSMYDDTPTSRFEEDMRAIIDGTPWPERPPKSKMEELLEELNDLIKAGGGGGGTSTIAWKPSVASDGTISWTRTASETKPDDQNIKGPAGQDGTNGADGKDGTDGADGLGIKQVAINGQGHLIITYDDDTTEDAGAIPGSSVEKLDDLTDVDITEPSSNQPITFNGTGWTNGGIIPVANGGTGNSSGYIRTGARANNTIGNNSTIEGYDNVASGQSSHAEGHSNVASGNYGAHAEGSSTTASGTYSHAEGLLSSATHNYAHAEGSSVASAQAAHSEGEGSTASAFCAHAGGNYGAASGSCSFSHGAYTNATAECSVAMGCRTNAGYVDQFVAGKYNSNKSTSIFEIGNGTGDGNRSNAIEVDTYGNTKIAGGIVAGGYIDDGYGHRLGFNKKTKINPFPEGASTITLYHENGITPISTSITDGVGMVDFNETQNGYEGFCIELNVTANTCYKIEFDYQNVDCQYWENQYTLGYQLTNTAVTDYTNQSLWTNNIQRTTGVQHFTASITSTGSKVYLCFNVCAYSDSRTNHATLSNLTVYELQEGTEDLSNYVQKSLTAGLLKNDGTVDTDTFVKTSNTAGLLKNDGTVDTTTYASEAGTESLINSTVGWTGKNELEVTLQSQSKNGLTITRNSDASISIYGTATAETWLEINGSALQNLLPAGNYIASGCPDGGSSSTYAIYATGNIAKWILADTPITIASGSASYFDIIVKNGVNMGTVDNPTVFYPMIRDARITDPTYEPYHESVEECLTEIDTAKQPKTLATPLTIGNVSRTTVEAALGALNDVTSDLSFYLENNAVTLSTSAATTVTFSSAKITTSSCIDVGVSEWGLVPDDVTVTNGTCTVTMPKVDSARTVTVRVYVK